MIGGLLNLGRGIAGATGRTAMATGRVAGLGALGLGGAIMGGAVGMGTGAIGAIRGSGVIGAARDNVVSAGKAMAQPVIKLAEKDLTGKKETEILEEIARNTDETAKNTDLVNPKSSGGQAAPLKSEDEIKKMFDQNKVLGDLSKVLAGLSATTVGLGVALAKFAAAGEGKGEGEGGDETNVSRAMKNLRIPSAAETKEAITDQLSDGSGVAGATLLGAGTAGTAARAVRDKFSTKTPEQRKFLNNLKEKSQREVAKKQGRTAFAKTVGKQVLKRGALLATGPAGAAVGAGMLAYDVTRGVMAATGIDDVVAGAGADFQEAQFSKKAAKERQERQDQMSTEFQNIAEDIQGSDLPEDRKKGYLESLYKAINADNQPMFDVVKKRLTDELMGGEASLDLSKVQTALDNQIAETRKPQVKATPTQVADTVETEVTNMTDTQMQASKAAVAPAPTPPAPTPPAADQDTIATTVTVDRKAKDSLAEELRKMNSFVGIPQGF